MATNDNNAVRTVRSEHKWFNQARFGMFIHWGPYAVYGRGEQVLMRERLDQHEYRATACAWNPGEYDPAKWADVAKRAGMRYAVLTTRHHDGYCLWDTRATDYSSAAQAPKRDFVREYVDAFRAAGLRVGLYYSLADFSNPAFFQGPEHNPAGWNAFIESVHAQVRELLTNYGKIDVIWFDGAWPWSSQIWRSPQLVKMMRQLQPDIMINNRLGFEAHDASANEEQVGAMEALGDFGTPEHHITAESGRLWESCQVSTWRLWSYSIGERWRPADLLLDMLVEAASKGGNLLLNVGPDAQGRLPQPFVERMDRIGQWMKDYSECIYGSEGGDVVEFVTRGWQITKGNALYLVIRFWDGRPVFGLHGLATPVRRATLMGVNKTLEIKQNGEWLTLEGLPEQPPTDLFPVIKLEFDEKPQALPIAKARMWSGDPRRFVPWASK